MRLLFDSPLGCFVVVLAVLTLAGLVCGARRFSRSYIAFLLWGAGWVSCWVSGNPRPPLTPLTPVSLLRPVQALGHLADPAAMTHRPSSMSFS